MPSYSELMAGHDIAASPPHQQQETQNDNVANLANTGINKEFGTESYENSSTVNNSQPNGEGASKSSAVGWHSLDSSKKTRTSTNPAISGDRIRTVIQGQANYSSYGHNEAATQSAPTTGTKRKRDQTSRLPKAVLLRPTNGVSSSKSTPEQYSKMQIDTEHFLRLQLAAREYILDENHPERMEIIAKRGSRDTDVTKAKLYNIVKAFLEAGDWGEEFWGENVPRGPGKTMIWKGDGKSDIIGAVTPLIRRVASNEKQRLYSLDKRLKEAEEGSAKRDRNASTATANGSDGNSPSPSPSALPDLDRGQGQLPHSRSQSNVKRSFSPAVKNPKPRRLISASLRPMFSLEPGEKSMEKYHINIMKNGKRDKPRFTMNPTTCPDYLSLMKVVATVEEGGRRIENTKIVGPNGLIQIKNELHWKDAISIVTGQQFFEGNVIVIVEMGITEQEYREKKLYLGGKTRD